MSRDISGDFAGLCTYTILVESSECPTGQYGVNAGSSATPQCVTAATLTTPYSAVLPGTAAETSFRVAVPINTAYIHVQIINSTSSTYLYGNPSWYGEDYYSQCYDSSSYNSATDNYDLDVYCYNPAAGYYYFYVYSTGSENLIGLHTVTLNTCAGNAFGYNCTYMAYNATDAPVTGSFGIDAGEGASSGFPDAYKAFYLTAPAGSMASANFSVTLTTGAGFVYYRRDGSIQDSSDYYLFYQSLTLNAPETVVLTPFDLYLGGTFYVAILNEGATGINFTMASSSAGPIITTTGASATDVSTAGTTGSSAVAIVASFQMVLALAMALIFA
jgi:hypothetical protein